jgi:hypothetical protein
MHDSRLRGEHCLEPNGATHPEPVLGNLGRKWIENVRLRDGQIILGVTIDPLLK